MLNHEALRSDSTCILEVESGKLAIERHSWVKVFRINSEFRIQSQNAELGRDCNNF